MQRCTQKERVQATGQKLGGTCAASLRAMSSADRCTRSLFCHSSSDLRRDVHSAFDKRCTSSHASNLVLPVAGMSAMPCASPSCTRSRLLAPCDTLCSSLETVAPIRFSSAEGPLRGPSSESSLLAAAACMHAESAGRDAFSACTQVGCCMLANTRVY